MRVIAAKPADRFSNAIEFMIALEHGALHTTSSQPRRRSVIERGPLQSWQIVAAVLALLLLPSVALQTRQQVGRRRVGERSERRAAGMPHDSVKSHFPRPTTTNNCSRKISRNAH
jgi:hypothetical protein